MGSKNDSRRVLPLSEANASDISIRRQLDPRLAGQVERREGQFARTDVQRGRSRELELGQEAERLEATTSGHNAYGADHSAADRSSSGARSFGTARARPPLPRSTNASVKLPRTHDGPQPPTTNHS